VGISIPQSIEAVIGVMGILKAGGAYVPLGSPSYPKHHINRKALTG
jgi:non-ribosomal peptide synthetase component F